MTIQATIQSLYADIAAIKEFICKEDSPSVFVSYAGSSTQPVYFPIPISVKKIAIYSNVTIPYSKIFDRSNQFYDEYTYEGLGSAMQIEQLGGGGFSHNRAIINMQLLVIDRIRRAELFHIRPRLGVEMFVTYYT